MKNSERAIERVLAGLGRADAPAGMEQRILKSLDEALDLARGGKRRRSREVGRRVWLGMAAWPVAARHVVGVVVVAGVLLVSLAIGWMRWVARKPVESRSVVTVESKRRVAAVELAPRADSEVEAKGEKVFRSGPSARVSGAVTARAQRVEAEGGEGDMEALALEEMRAQSQPAPPLPLTEQERLLLRVVHQGGPEGLAALDPARRAAQDREERAEVERFFEPKTAEANE